MRILLISICLVSIGVLAAPDSVDVKSTTEHGQNNSKHGNETEFCPAVVETTIVRDADGNIIETKKPAGKEN